MASASSFWDRNRLEGDLGNRRADSRHEADNHHEAGSHREAADHIHYVAGSRYAAADHTLHLVADNLPHHTADGDEAGNCHVVDNLREAGSRREADNHLHYVAGSRPHLVADNHPRHTADGDVVGNRRVADSLREAGSRHGAADHIDDGAGSRVHAEECYWSDQRRIPQDGNRPLLDCH